MQQVRIGKNEAGQRLDKFLGKYFKEATTSFLYKMLRKKNIELNGKKASGNEKLCVDDVIGIFMANETIAKFRGIGQQTTKTVDEIKPVIPSKTYDFDVEKNIIYEDENVIFINKPTGILSQKSSPTDISLNEIIIDYLLEKNVLTREELLTFKPSICNRLDRNTSGLITFGKSLAGIQELSKGFKDRTFDKYYIAVVWGKLTEKRTIEGYLIKDNARNRVTITKDSPASVDSSLYIKTEYEPVKHGILDINGAHKSITLLKVKLITGKTHQIRAHLSSIGHSILGDDKYGIANANKYLKKNFKINYQMLHSYELHFNKLPEDEYKVLRILENMTFKAEYDKIYDKIFEVRNG